MSGILPSASNHPVWSPIAGEIHAVIWDRVGLGIVQGFVREWASNWNAKASIAKTTQQEPRQALNPALPLPPSPHSPRSLAEKWASLAAIHDVYDLTGDTVLPWPLPEDDLDLKAFTNWFDGDAGAYQLLMRKALELPPDCKFAIRRWLADVSKDTPPNEMNLNDHSQPANPSAMAEVEKIRQEALLASLSPKNRLYVFCGRIWSE